MVAFCHDSRPKEEDLMHLIRDMAAFSRTIWGYFGYTGLLEPWHDYHYLEGYISKQKRVKGGKTRYPFEDFYNDFISLDVPLSAYSVLVLPLAEPSKWEQPLSCFKAPSRISWVRNLREYCGSRKNVEKVSWFLWKFYQLQVQHYNRGFLNLNHLVKIDESDRFCGIYYDIFNRIRQFELKGVDFLTWCEVKFNKIRHTFHDDIVTLPMIVNFNYFELKDGEMESLKNDSWRTVRDFLGLSSSCEFPDGFIPKGWTPRSSENTDKISKVLGDGSYTINDSVWRGTFHYSKNHQLIIKCTPDNFSLFKETWYDKLSGATPTWSEYNDFGVTSFYNEDGSSKEENIKFEVKWRR
jgi:hypothetical protein